MSIEIRVKIICDGCGVSVDSPVGCSSIHAKAPYYEALREIERQLWIVAPRYGKPKHYCQKCADGAPGVTQQPIHTS